MTAVRIRPGEHIVEQLELLKRRTALGLNGKANESVVLAVTSCQPGEGVTTVAVNLAASLAGENRGRVLLLDGNLVSPTLHTVFSIEDIPGIVTTLESPYKFKGTWPILRSDENLNILFAGGKTESPENVFCDPRFKDLLKRVKESFKYTIIDAPPVLGKNSSISLPTMADAVIFVVEAGKVRREVVKRATEMLEQAGANILGVVLNKRRYPIPNFIYRRL